MVFLQDKLYKFLGRVSLLTFAFVSNKYQQCKMSDCCEYPVRLCQFPTELLIYIFKNLPAKDLVICRRVCSRWKAVIDHISNDDDLWEKYCEDDFRTVYREAKKKSDSCRLWFDIYRSLSLWGRLSAANEVQDEFCRSSSHCDFIRDLRVLKNGVFCVHKHAAVVYYDIATLKVTQRHPLYGDFSRFVELEDETLIILGNQLHLRIVKKPQPKQIDALDSDWTTEHEIQQDDEVIFYNTKYFLTVGRDVYFVNFGNDIYHCNVDGQLTASPLQKNNNEHIVALSFYNGYVNILTIEGNVYAYKNNTFIKLFNLESKINNIFDCLWQYQYIEKIDWLIFYTWIARFNIKIPDNRLRYICMIRIYGDVFFIGTKMGILLTYYKPYVNGHLDFYNHTPVKEYRLDDHPVVSLQPILAVDIIETKGGHKLLIAMRKKVVIITYAHNFEVIPSKAVLQSGAVAVKV